MKFRIFARIMFSEENRKLDCISKLYLLQNYRSNLGKIKKRNNLSLMNKIFSIQLKKNENTSLLDKCKLGLIDIIKINDVCSKNLPNLENELKEIKENIRQKRIKKITETIIHFVNKINIKHLLDLKNSQNNVKQLFNFLSRNIEIYKRSIQELVEGQREVTQNKNFQFEDGETVQEKMDKFELKLKENLSTPTNILDIKKTKNKFI